MNYKNYMKTWLCAMVWLICAAGTHAQIVVEKHSQFGKPEAATWLSASHLDLSGYSKQVYDDMTVYRPEPKMAVRKTNEEMVSVYLQFVCDLEELIPEQICIYNEAIFSSEGYDGEHMAYNVTVPEGTYDIMALFRNNEAGYLVVVIKELVAVSNGDTYTCDAAEATKQIKFDTYDEKGEPLTVGMVEGYDENGELIMVSEGNYHDWNYYDYIYLKGKGDVLNVWNYGWGYLHYKNVADFYVNALSDRYQLMRGGFLVADNKNVYANKYVLTGTEKKVVANEWKNYRLLEEKYEQSPLSREHIKDGPFSDELKASSSCVGIKCVHCIDEKFHGSFMSQNFYQPLENNTMNIYLNIAPSQANDDDPFDIFIMPDFTNDVAEEMWGGLTTSSITALPVITESGTVKHLCYGVSYDSGYFCSSIDSEYGTMYPGHPRFSYLESQKKMVVGGSCPIMVPEVGYYMMDDEGNKGFFGAFHQLGRLGEQRRSDEIYLHQLAKGNGEVVYDDTWQNGAAYWSFYAKNPNYGMIDEVLENPNVEVDGLLGKNVTTLHYDLSAMDFNAPTVTMLQFRDADDHVTDHFATASDGTLQFSAGDFNFQMNAETGWSWYECTETNVEVAYSPYGLNAWKSLLVEMVPEYYRMPGFGYYYSGSLQDVEGTGEKGWFDLKIKLTDAVGNWQEQVVSPAFRIDDQVMTGICEFASSSSYPTNSCFAVDGKLLSTPQKGLNIICHSNGRVVKQWVR